MKELVDKRLTELQEWLDMRIESAYNASNVYRPDMGGEKVRTPEAEKAFYYQQAFEVVALRIKHIFGGGDKYLARVYIRNEPAFDIGDRIIDPYYYDKLNVDWCTITGIDYDEKLYHWVAELPDGGKLVSATHFETAQPFCTNRKQKKI